ncbi:hypothetical protein [Kitasatospora sp. NPDC088783]|uniref:hypothetical protein n=1 Tax=Kitasatospora sp. NPDC088783 TaxID=3364077 RepID=UPI0037F8EC05
MEIRFGAGESVEVPDDLGAALLAGLRGERPPPPQDAAFDGLAASAADLTRLIQHLGVDRELTMCRADAAGAYSNRTALANAAQVSESQLSRILQGHGLPGNRRRDGVDLVVAFRTAHDGRLHLAAEPDVADLPSFTLPPPSVQGARAAGRFAGRELTFYYRPQVPIPEARLGRSAGYTLRAADRQVVGCVTGDVFDALLGDPRLDPTRPDGR